MTIDPIVDPEINLGDMVIDSVVVTFIPIVLGIYCVRRGRKSPVAVPPIDRPIDRPIDKELPPKCQDCKRTDDLAQCPECHQWFCGEDDPHYCIPQRTADLQERIALLNRRADLGGDIMFWCCCCGGFVFLAGMIFLSEWPNPITEHWGLVSPEAYYTAVGIVALVAVALVVLGSVLGYVIGHYYEFQLRKYRAHFRSIRPETAKRDGDQAKKRKPLIR